MQVESRACAHLRLCAEPASCYQQDVLDACMLAAGPNGTLSRRLGCLFYAQGHTSGINQTKVCLDGNCFAFERSYASCNLQECYAMCDHTSNSMCKEACSWYPALHASWTRNKGDSCDAVRTDSVRV